MSTENTKSISTHVIFPASELTVIKRTGRLRPTCSNTEINQDRGIVMLKSNLIGSLAIAAFAVSAQAQTNGTLSEAFVKADELFAARDNGLDATLAAKAAYQAIIAQGAKDADLVRAVEGLARATYFQGEVLTDKATDAGKKARKAIFNECWNGVIAPIAPENLGYESPVYYYFKGTCLAHEAEVSSVLERLVNLPKLLDTFTKGLLAPGGDIFEGGGLKRVKAAVKGNVEAKGLPGGLYNPDEALKIVEEAIAAPAADGNAEGFLFCENFYRKALILSTVDRKADAKAVAEQTLADFEGYQADGLIPEFIRAETVHCLETVKDLSSSL